jgi:crotonobetainyl-CoA:carnitine CoA-transferase CaiB-like acyl-CoA transferase
MAGPLAGVRIIDLTSVLMGPYATQILGDLGADVIKVEAPEGDRTRGIGPMRSKGMGPLYLNLNRNKRSIVLDLKQPAGREALLSLVKDADVLTYNLRPHTMRSLGLAYEALRAVNPGIIYVGMFGFSQRGPYAEAGAVDDVIQGATGIPMINAQHTGGIPRFFPVTIADRSVGLYAMGMINAALYHKAKTGEGQAIDVPMFETMTTYVLGDHLYGHTFEPPLGEFGYPRLVSSARRPYATRDGVCCCVVYTDKDWKAFLQRIGKGELFTTDPRFRDMGSRTRHISELYQMVSDELASRTTAEIMALLDGSGIPTFPVHTFETLMQDPHLKAIGLFEQVEHPSEGALVAMQPPGEWSHTRPAISRHAPLLGEHSVEVLREAGLAANDIARLVEAGVTVDGRR